MSFASKQFTGTLSKPESYRLERIVVVTAFIGEDFLASLLRSLKPDKAHIVLDEGTSGDAVERVRAGSGKRLGRLLLGVAPHLMHAKLYFLTWRNGSTGRRAYRLHWGSANASAAGFSPKSGNAEVYAWSPVRPKLHADIISWFDAIAAGEEELPRVHAAFGDVHLDLPGFELREPSSPPSFDAWLRRGCVCHRYERDPAFLAFTLPLRQALPRERVAETFGSVGLLEEGARTRLRFRYLPAVDSTPSDSAEPRWRASYFVDTLLGFWTSERCFRAREDQFVVAGKEVRKQEIESLLAAGSHEESVWISSFGAAIRAVEARLTGDGEDLASWFDLDGGHIAIIPIEERARKALARDRAKAESKDYAKRHISGIEFLRLPGFYDDPEQWEAFATSFAASLVLPLQKGKVDNKIARSLRDWGVLSADDTAESALAALRARWEEVCEEVEAALEGEGESGDEETG